MARLVKRYSNRKLYDTTESRYVTLDEIARWVRAGEDVKITENENGEDLTAVTFAQIILEGERKKSGLLSLGLMRELIQHGEAALQNLAATVDRGMEVIRSAPERAGRRVQELTRVADRLAELQKRVDEVVRRSVERVTGHPAFQQEIKRIERTMQALETRIGRLRGGDEDSTTGDIPPPPDGTVIPLRKASGTMVTPPAQGVMRGGRLLTDGWPQMAAHGEALGPEGTVARLFCALDSNEGTPTKFLRGCNITVVVRKPDGAPAAGVNVAIFDQGNNLKAQAATDAEGVAKLEKLDGRLGSLCVLGGSQWQREQIGTVDLRKGDMRIEYTLLSRRAVEIRVVVDGTPTLPEGRQLWFDVALEKFADDAGKKGGEFYTPHMVVQAIVEVLAPTEGMRICDPTCGSGGMLVACAKYIERRGGNAQNLTLHGLRMAYAMLAR